MSLRDLPTELEIGTLLSFELCDNGYFLSLFWLSVSTQNPSTMLRVSCILQFPKNSVVRKVPPFELFLA